MAPSPQTVIALISITISVASIVVAFQSRARRIRAEASATRAIRISREQRITQHLESSGGCARLVVDDLETGRRPTHPDGTPYRYSEITAGGWDHCDGCRRWGQWTAEKPHDCPGPYINGPSQEELRRLFNS
ncbi:hypothetical protein [Streptomyces sp. NBC_00842]|uniref:hypothetical protein n=1 Tax=Streptomyces sp. NBC_00842 TaxID=2975848 RepID=UPI002F91B4B5|nr:hypothetical protein OH821_45510 [Streptomyces sp. NBC_00842]